MLEPTGVRAPGARFPRLDPGDSRDQVCHARLVFQRAAEGGNAVAALALGATYDPVVLASLGVRGVDADVAKARTWYQRAKDFGEPEASRRLDVLANRTNR